MPKRIPNSHPVLVRELLFVARLHRAKPFRTADRDALHAAAA